MSDLVERVRSGGLLAAGRPVVVLLSGGRDSVCLLGVAAEVGAGVRALHVDYGLRPESGADARLCAAVCARLEVEIETLRPRAPGGGNLQAWARDVRYARANALAAALGADVAAGHTATDQAETILYRLASSPGRRALLGMAPRSGRLVRPLLGVTREETAAWCRARDLPWSEDASNDDARFARNRVRAGLLPALRAIHPGAEANVVRTAELLRDEAAVLDAAVDGVLGGRACVELQRLRELPVALARLVVVRLSEDAAGALVPRAAARTEEILALDPARAWTALDIGDGVRAVVEGGMLRMERSIGGPPANARSGTSP
jgi:tRNA(Ile)-lysidine synthase